MRLVPDVVRDILLYIEQNQKSQYDNKGVFEVISISPKHILDELGETTRYTREEGEYAIRLLYNEKIILGNATTGKNNRILTLSITGISFEGHQFLDHIRDNTIWNKVKQEARKHGIYAIKDICQISKTIIGKMIENPEMFSEILNELRN